MCSENKLPNPGQSYKDERGTQVTIVSIEGGRVAFMREGYSFPCMRPMYNSLAKFRLIK
ncbi:DUF4222 domain-containing protein [Escherichia coli]|uniref:DUF4222 domain-containing protein n=1 Tax=Escherichia coli TaxID=562 RepID=UPI000940723F|nr:DUF4222 domain-containing protein [Escherichia coli]